MSTFKCRSCGKECDEDSILCPNCGANPKKKEQIKRSPEQFNLLWEGLRNRIILGAVFWGAILSLIFGITLNWVYREASDSMQRFIEKEVEQQFKEPDIKDVINSAAAAKAEQHMSEAITPEVEKARQEIHSALERTTKLMQETQEQLDQIRRIIELEDVARSGSRSAYVSLREIASSEGSLTVMAKGRISSIEDGLLSYRTVPSREFGLTIMQGNQRINLETLSTAELFEGLQSPSLPKDYIPSIMAYIVERPKEEVCQSAKELLEQSDSLVACAATCGILMKILGNKAPFLQFEQWIQACENE